MKLVCLVAFAACLSLQAGQIETAQDLQSKLNAEQKPQFDSAVQAFSHEQYADALPVFKALLQQLPGDAVLSKFASEAALNSGDAKFAIDTLRPIEQAHPDDWQSVSLLARAYALSGDNKARDAAMAHMIELRKQGVTPQNMRAYMLEVLKIGDNTLIIRPSLVPWGPYNVYYFGQLMNAQRQIFLRMSVESSDADQGLFAKEHPKEAAQGLRLFSMDGYQQMGPNTQTHLTFGFYTGEPSYDAVREKFLAIAQGKAAVISSRTGLQGPRQ